MKTFAQHITNFYFTLDRCPAAPSGVGVLDPYKSEEVRTIVREFYFKYYNDREPRIFLIGINPGRHGAGVTGIGFTDPIRLQEICKIANNFDLKPELSSKFIYQIIQAWGGVEAFYRKFYFSSVSPLGFTQGGKNLNYYDISELQNTWEPFMLKSLKTQLAAGGSKKIAFVLGQGKNYKYLNQLNEKYGLVETLVPLPHPRWVMQYRLKKLDFFIQEYITKLGESVMK